MALAAGIPVRVGVVEIKSHPGHAPRAVEFLRNLGVQQIHMDRERRPSRSPSTRGCIRHVWLQSTALGLCRPSRW